MEGGGRLLCVHPLTRPNPPTPPVLNHPPDLTRIVFNVRRRPVGPLKRLENVYVPIMFCARECGSRAVRMLRANARARTLIEYIATDAPNTPSAS